MGQSFYSVLLLFACAPQLIQYSEAAEPLVQDSETETSSDEASPDEPSTFPPFDFSTIYAPNAWILGPFPKDDPFDKPGELIQKLTDRQAVTLKSGVQRTWQQIEAVEDGYFSLEDHCRRNQAAFRGTLLYVAVPVRSETGGEYELAGATTNSPLRSWVINESGSPEDPDKTDRRRFDVALQPGETKHALFEITTSDGDPSFRFESGDTWKGMVRFADKLTPNPGATIEVYSSDGRRLCSDVSNSHGKVTLKPVPYHAEVTVKASGYPAKLDWMIEEKSGDREFKCVAPRPSSIVISDLTENSDLPRSGIAKIRYEESSGRIFLLSEQSRDRIHILTGSQLTVHPLTEDLPDIVISDFYVTDNGALCLRTARSGLLYLNSKEKLQFFAASPLEGFRLRETPPDVSLQNPDKIRYAQGRVWIANHRYAERKPRDDTSREMQILATETVIYTIADDDTRLKVACRLPGDVGTLQISRDRIVYTDRKSVYLCTHEGTPIRTSELPFPVVWDCQLDDQGAVWVAGNSEVAMLPDQGDWKFPAAIRDFGAGSPTSLFEGDDTWATTLLEVILMRNGAASYSSIEHLCSTRWGDAGILLGTSDGRVLGVCRGQTVPFGSEDQVSKGQNWMTSTTEHGTVLSGFGMRPLFRRPNGQASKLPRFVTVTAIPVADDELIAVIGGLMKHVPEVMNCPPVVIRYQGTQTEFLQLPTDQPQVNYADVLILKDGRALIGTNVGLFEYRDGEISLAAPEETGPALSVQSLALDTNSDVWVGTTDGKLGSLTDSPEEWFELPKGDLPVRQARMFVRCSLDSEVLDGQWMVGTNSGLYLYDDRQKKIRRMKETPFPEDAFIQDISVAPNGGPIVVAVRGFGVFSFAYDFWTKIRLDDDPDLTSVWDVSHQPDGVLWLTTTDQFYSYKPRNRELRIFVDSINTDAEQDAASVASGVLQVECDDKVTVEITSSRPAVHVGYRFRSSDADPWQSILSDDRTVEVPMNRTGKFNVQVQSFDKDHNLSQIATIPVEVYLPLWRQQWFRRMLVGGLIATSLIALVSSLAWRRSRKARWQTVMAARKTAEENAQQQESLLLRVCHDLKNPLHVVSACTEMLNTGKLPVQESARLLKASAESIGYLSHQLLSYSSLQREAELKCIPVYVKSLLEDVRLQHLLTVERKGGVIEVSVGDEVPPWIMTDPQASHEVLSNLVGNAAKHCPSGIIEIAAELVDGYPQISVRDTGPGIPEADLELIFDAFYQSDNARNGKGVGLGLAICRSLTEKLGGSVTVKNRPNHGAEFIVRLPTRALITSEVAVPTGQPDSQPEQVSPEQTLESATEAAPIIADFQLKKSRGKTLVVDDLQFVGLTLVHLLNQSGIEAVYSGPFDAAQVSREQSFDEVLIDLNMSGKDGFEVARELRELHGDAIHIRAMSEDDSILEQAKTVPVFHSVISKSALFLHTESSRAKRGA